MSPASWAIIALGSNLGDSVEIIQQAMAKLKELSVQPLVRSSLWRTTPVDCPSGADDFINAVVKLRPRDGETAETLLGKLQGLEKDFGRRPKKLMNEARPLDLDLITFGEETRSGPELILPHPRAHLRRFVLAPLAEIEPDLVLPGQQKSVRELLATLRTDEKIQRASG